VALPDYVRDLRAAIGSRRLILVGASAIICDEAGWILLIRRGDTGQWALPAGIMEMDETIADTIVREVREETGLEVKPVRLTGLYTDPDLQNMTYPNGDQVHVVNATFECQVVSGQARPDGAEALEATYFPRDGLPTLRPGHLVRIQDALGGRPEAFFR
jgi:ADP-ribose pyrophosphatase YjhB (NUDIX family)